MNKFRFVKDKSENEKTACTKPTDSESDTSTGEKLSRTEENSDLRLPITDSETSASKPKEQVSHLTP